MESGHGGGRRTAPPLPDVEVPGTVVPDPRLLPLPLHLLCPLLPMAPHFGVMACCFLRVEGAHRRLPPRRWVWIGGGAGRQGLAAAALLNGQRWREEEGPDVGRDHGILLLAG